jgi:hypothetical protein
MKRIVFLALILTLITTAVSAQRITRGVRSDRGQITRFEARQLQRDQRHYKVARRMAVRDRVVTPRERRRLKAIRKHERRDLFRFRHNNRRRVI